ncbi:hypothetical protein [Rhizobacter fulvus]
MAVFLQSETILEPSVDASSPEAAQAAAVACAYLLETRQHHKSHAFQVFFALAQATRERSLRGLAVEFSAANLKAAVAPHAAKEASGWMSPHWARLTSLELEWQEGLTATARVLSLRFTPRLRKDAGSPALYTLEPVPLSDEEPGTPLSEVPDGGVRYTPEAVKAPAAWLSSALKSGVVRWTVGIRWGILGALVLTTVVVLLGIWAVFTVGIRSTRALSLADVLGIISVAAIALWLMSLYRFLDDLFDLRIVMAPLILTPFAHHNVTLEARRRDSEDEVGELAFVRYSAICPLCDGSVSVMPGRRRFPDRLVGRCRGSGREHVFSFDHVLRVGRQLV